MPVVDYDCVINFSTIQWVYFDVSADFDLANHTDYDVHVSLLYDVGSAEPTGFKGMRTGFPAGRDARIGLINPPASPRVFSEERISGDSLLSSTKFDGYVDVLVSESSLGVQNKVLLKNSTSMATIDITDTPIDLGTELIADANALIDGIGFIRFERPQPADLVIDLSDSFDMRSFFSVSSDINIDYTTRTVSGYIYLAYNTSLVHVSDAYIDTTGWEPELVITGLSTPDSAYSPLTIRVDYYSGSMGLLPVLQGASLSIYLLCNPKFISPSNGAYRWIEVEYSFGQYNWRNEAYNKLLHSTASDVCGMSPAFLPLKGVQSHRASISEYVYAPPISYRLSVPSRPSIGTFGTVISLIRADTIWPFISAGISVLADNGSPSLVGSANTDCAVYRDVTDECQVSGILRYSMLSGFSPLQISWDD